MKLQRFIAETNQKAIFKIHQSLGPDALIYSTRNTENGVEMLAALPSEAVDEVMFADEAVQSKGNNLDNEFMQRLDAKIQMLDENLKQLTVNLKLLTEGTPKKQNFTLNLFKKWDVVDNIIISLKISMLGMKSQLQMVERTVKNFRVGKYERTTA